MKWKIFFLLLFIASLPAFSQDNPIKNRYLNVSGGRVLFGTGDIPGFGIAVELTKNSVNESRPGLSKLLIGGELIFENGSRNPKTSSTNMFELRNSFYHTSTTTLWPKISYFPFQKILKGFHIQVGPTVGYSYRSSESRVSIDNIPSFGEFNRLSVLYYDNDFTIGYRISTGYEFDLIQHITTGIRFDFSNNNDGDINTLLGLKFGFKF